MEAGTLELFRAGGELDRHVRTLADASPLTIVVGAGASMESGLSDWRDLVARLLRAAARHRGLRGASAAAFVEWTLERESVTAAASIARTSMTTSERFVRALRAALYGTDRVFAKGETAAAVARLRLLLDADRPSGSEVVTTNYDRFIEEAIAAEAGTGAEEVDVRTVAGPRPQRPGEVVVRHLHGVVAPDRRRAGTVVLSEADYHLMQDERAWQEHWFTDRLRQSTCMFVATSLTDPNLLRYLHRQPEGTGPHFACFARQQEAPFYDGAGPKVVAAREAAVAARWRAVGITPVVVSHYRDTAQFVHEVVLRRRLGRDYVDLPSRLRVWEERMARGALTTAADTFRGWQDDLCTVLADLVGGVRAVLEQGTDADRRTFRVGADERLQCSLWVYRPSADALVNWASSDRAWRDPATLEPVPVRWDSDFAAVRAYCNGSLVDWSTAEQAATRWNHVVAAPLYLEDGELGRLPVGAFTLASTVARPDSVLARAMDVVRNLIVDEIASRLADLVLRPKR